MFLIVAFARLWNCSGGKKCCCLCEIRCAFLYSGPSLTSGAVGVAKSVILVDKSASHCLMLTVELVCILRSYSSVRGTSHICVCVAHVNIFHSFQFTPLRNIALKLFCCCWQFLSCTDRWSHKVSVIGSGSYTWRRSASIWKWRALGCFILCFSVHCFCLLIHLHLCQRQWLNCWRTKTIFSVVHVLRKKWLFNSWVLLCC